MAEALSGKELMVRSLCKVLGIDKEQVVNDLASLGQIIAYFRTEIESLKALSLEQSRKIDALTNSLLERGAQAGPLSDGLPNGSDHTN